MLSWESQRVFKICFCFVLIYKKNHLMTGPLGNSAFVSLESQCFPRLRLNEKFTVPLGTSH